MKKCLGVLIVLAAVFCMASAESYDSVYYTVNGDVSPIVLERTGKLLDMCWSAYNSVFHFNQEGTGFKLPVTVYPDKLSYDAFVQEKTSSSRDGYVYLKYSKAEKSPLMLYAVENDVVWNKSFIRQSYLQYLYSFIKNPPIWIREGFALYFDSLDYNEETNSLSFATNSPWLDHVKKLRISSDKTLTADTMISTASAEYETNVLYPQTWALVTFMIQTSDKSISRLLWDSFYQLSANATLEDNTAAVAKSIAAWKPLSEINEAFTTWLAQNRTFNELLSEGSSFYNQSLYDDAEKSFIAAMNMNPESPAPLYYMGLIAYARQKYEEAGIFYKAALQNSTDTAIVNWALGLNAYAAGKKEESATYIQAAATTSPERYAAKAAEMMKRLE